MDITKISAYFILYHDLQFLDDIIAQIYPFVDEIVIIDGPYEYAVKLLKQCELFYDESIKPAKLTELIIKYPKIVYKYGIFTCEEEKRMLGYNSCSYNNILLVDSDEFFVIHADNVHSFIKNDAKFVAGFDIYNMNRINISFNKMSTKFVFFKRNKISALDHLDYLWLVGCKTKEKVERFMDVRNALGVIYHQTLNRNKFNTIIKYIFYVSLYHKNNGNNIRLFNNYTMEQLLEKLSVDRLLTLFYHSRIETLGMPTMGNTNICVENIKFQTELAKYANNHSDAYFRSDATAIENISAHFLLLKSQFTRLKIVFDNVKSIDVTLYEIPIGCEYVKHTFNYNNVLENKITIEYTCSKERLLDTIIRFDCSSTVDGSFNYKIKSIEFDVV